MKFLKHLFTVPEGEKVTDRHLKRILLSSVCGILLCMTCLMSTTWAWYTVTLESDPITIQVAEYSLTVEVDGTALTEQTHTLEANAQANVEFLFETDATAGAMNPTPSRYVVITVSDETGAQKAIFYVLVGTENKLTLSTDEACTVQYALAWQAPGGESKQLENGASVILIDLSDETTGESGEEKDDTADSDIPADNSGDSASNNEETRTEGDQTTENQESGNTQPDSTQQDSTQSDDTQSEQSQSPETEQPEAE